MTAVNDLLATALSRRVSSTDALGALGLLLEAARATHPAGDDGGLADLLPPELARHRLTDTERRKVIGELSRTLWGQRTLNHSLIWALSKSADPVILPVLERALNRAVKSGQQDAASEALNGLALFWPDSAAAVRYAAQYGQGDVKAQAEDLLERWQQDEAPSI
ncbi:hypothetical protein GCM10008959_26630 [Deinococcus seoulensis]|uniref:HEAT repeat domain-containing protein n=1 Tax=Deinococcus seoulensis TaxID=1837379 RepID=A0ABQ2RX89_9DEIO|nr:hypothetical protein [Deinococcus seoulensis]GGR63282.1 hypothetical protein GCM10008959_26630 [Deinococcus seoulensis]